MIIALLLSTIYFALHSFRYWRKSVELQRISDTDEKIILNYHFDVVELDAVNSALKAQVSRLKLTISELKAGISTGYPPVNGE